MLGRTPSAGHVPFDAQFSATSQSSPADTERHSSPTRCGWQLALQQPVNEPLFGPSSQTSPRAVSTTPFPQKLRKSTVTKCPSFAWVLDGLPGYAQALQPVTVPLFSPMRIAASQLLLRALALQVKVRTWDCATPLLDRMIVAVVVLLNGLDVVLPPTPSDGPSVKLRLPFVRAMLEEPVIAPSDADPSHPEASLTRFTSPTRLLVIVTWY